MNQVDRVGFNQGIKNIFASNTSEILIQNANENIKDGKSSDYLDHFIKEGLKVDLEFRLFIELNPKGNEKGFIPQIYYGPKNKSQTESQIKDLSHFYHSKRKASEYLARQFYYELRNSIAA